MLPQSISNRPSWSYLLNSIRRALAFSTERSPILAFLSLSLSLVNVIDILMLLLFLFDVWLLAGENQDDITAILFDL